MKIFQIVKSSHRTTKTASLVKNKQRQWLTFKVEKSANKHDIKLAVKDLFPNLLVDKVHTITMKPTSRVFRQVKGEHKGFKKAYVALRQITEGNKNA